MFSFGIQAYWGGLAASVVLSSIFPSFHGMANTLPESAQITTQALIGFIIYIFIFTPIMFVHPSRLQPVLAIVSELQWAESHLNRLAGQMLTQT
jgi:NCS1 family nucleobase:cation symporter-1